MKIGKTMISGVAVGVALVMVLSVAALSDDWVFDKDDPSVGIGFQPEEGGLGKESINYVLFEEYGHVMLLLALMMFGSIIAGVCISKEDDEYDSD
jgi:hypothetical protein